MPGGRMSGRQMKQMMRKMGISTEEIEGVEEVIIRTADKEYVIKEPSVTVVVAQGQKTFQVIGEPEILERGARKDEKADGTKAEEKRGIPDEDVELVASQTGASMEEARQALEECGGEPAEAIMRLLAKKG